MARLKAISDSEWNYKNSIKSQTILLRPDGVHLNTAKDYGLSKVGVLYQEKGTQHFIMRYPLFKGYGYCGCCIAVMAQYTSADVATVVVVLQYLHNTSADVATMVVVLQYLYNSSSNVATVVVVLQYLHNSSTDVTTVVVVLQYLHNTSSDVATVVILLQYLCNT